MRTSFAPAVGWAAVAACAAIGFLGPLGNSAWANTSTPAVLGIDVYGGNGTMNWTTIASNGIQFAWAKATQGNYYEDNQLANNESGATANGIYIGAYDFADPSNVDPLTEATYFVNFAKQYGSFNTGKLLPALDMEQVGSTIDGASSLTAWINAWAADVYTLASVKPLLYCSPSFLSNNNITSTGLPLWEADWTYPSNLSNTGPPSGSWSPWSTWTFWQYSDKGSVGGDPSTVDLDAYNGTLSSMVANELVPALTWTGNTSGTWNISSTGTKNWNYGSTTGTSNEAYYYDGRGVVFPDTNLATNSQVTNSSVNISSVVTPQSLDFTANTVNYTFTGAAIAGTGGITLGGTASVTLNNATSASPNTFSGAIAINKGQLILDQAWSMGDSSGATVASGGALVLNNTSGSATTFGNLTGGGGTVQLSLAGTGWSTTPAGALESMKGNNTYSGAISLSANATIESASTASGDGLNLAGGVATNGHTLTFAGSGTTTLSSLITGTGSLVLAGGRLSLAAPVEEIGVNSAADQNATDGATTGEQPEQIGTTAVAGVVPISNWNDFNITRFKVGENKSSSNLPQAQSIPTSPTPFTLTDATGATTTAQVTAWSGSNTFSVYGSTQTVANAQLVNGLLCGINDNSNPNHPATFTISNIPYAGGYNVYVYFNNNNAAEAGQLSVTSGAYTSATYYVQTEGEESAPASPFFVSGTSSTTAGNYTTSNYVDVPIPAAGTDGATSQFTVTLSVPQSGANQNTPGIAAIEIVADATSVTLNNAVSVTSNSTIDLTGVNSATMGAFSIGTKTLSITGGSIGVNNPYTLTLGPTTLTGNATFQVANNSSGSGAQGTLQLGAIGQSGGTFGVAIKGPGEVVFTSAGTYGGPTLVQSGQLLLSNGTAMGNSSSASVASGAALLLNNTSNGSLTFGNTANGSTTIGLTINGAGLAANPGGALYNFAGSNTYTGGVTLGSSATISAATNTTLTLSGPTVAPTGDTLSYGGGGTVLSTGTMNLGNNAAIQVNTGTTVLSPGSMPTIGSSITATVASGATLQLAGATSALSNSSSGNSANIANNGTLSIAGSAETVGTISGSGNTAVANGSNLTASQIVQNTLTIGAGSSVTIVPSGIGNYSAATSSAVTSSSSISAAVDLAAAASSDSSSSDSNVGNTDIGSIQTAIDSGEISGGTGEIMEDRITNNTRMAAEDPALNVALLDGKVMTELAKLELAPPSDLAGAGLGTVTLDAGPPGFDSGPAAGLTVGPSAVPEPSSLLLAALGAISLALALSRGWAIRR